MARTAVEDAVQEPDLLRLREPVRRYLGRAVHDEQELDDLVQETLLRVWEVRGRVGRTAAASYAVATARNLVQSRDRALRVHERHAHRLHEPPTVDGPEVDALRQEERLAAAEVLGTLRDEDRTLLSQDDAAADVERTARRRSSLARARSRARVDYLLHLRRLALPTPRCRPVLEALSAGDRRQQHRVGVAQHLLTCPVCASCAKALLARERRLFGVVAIPLLVLLEPLRRAREQAPRTTSAVAAGAVLAALVTGGAVALRPDAEQSAATAPAAGAPVVPVPPPAHAPAPAAGQPLVLGSDAGFTGALADMVGQQVTAKDVVVRSVPADEGFWVGPDDAHQFYVRLSADGESPQAVRPGDRVSFEGRVQRLAPGVDDGLVADEGLADLQGQQAYLDVPAAGLTFAALR